MNPARKRLRLAVLLFCGTMFLLAVDVALPGLLKFRWASCGVPVLFKVSVTDAQTGQPVPRAKVLHWPHWEEGWFQNDDSVGHIAATTDTNGTCQVHADLPGSGSGNKGHLKPNWTIWVRAEGYEPWQKPVSALLGSSVTVTNAFQTNSFPLKIMLTRK